MLNNAGFKVGHRYLVKISPIEPGVEEITILEIARCSEIMWVLYKDRSSDREAWSGTLQLIKELPLKKERVKTHGRSRIAKNSR